MFIAHFGAGFAAKSATRTLSLGWLFLAAQFIDLLWPTLLLLGLEHVRIAPGATAVTPLAFEHYPISHSLLAVIGWAVLVGGAALLLRRDMRAALLLAVLVVSHWLLDLLVHIPDLPLWPGSTILAGLGAWTSLTLTLVLEGSFFTLGVWLYSRATVARDAAGRWGFRTLVAFLALVYAMNLAGDPPPSSTAIAWVGQSQWLLVLWAFWLDRHRTPSRAPEHGI